MQFKIHSTILDGVELIYVYQMCILLRNDRNIIPVRKQKKEKIFENVAQADRGKVIKCTSYIHGVLYAWGFTQRIVLYHE